MIRVLVVGCGNMSRAWIQFVNQREDAQICALVDVNIEQANAYIERYALDCPVFTDLQEALLSVKPDVVFDTTPPECHYDVTTSALRAGCCVFGEKPMAPSLDAARAMLDLANQTGKSYAVMQNRRYLKTIRDFKELLGSAGVGRLALLSADFYIGAHFGGFRDLMDSPLLLDMAIHTFDMARFLCGANAVSVYCQESNPPWSWYKGAPSAVCIFEMDNGCVFSYRGSWCAEGCPTEWESDWRGVGEFGTAVWTGKDNIFAELVSEPDSTEFIRPVRRVLPSGEWSGRLGHDGCLDAMFDALIQGTQPETRCQDNIHSMEMVFGAIESARTGQKILL